jgi:hypothetical protein
LGAQYTIFVKNVPTLPKCLDGKPPDLDGKRSEIKKNYGCSPRVPHPYTTFVCNNCIPLSISYCTVISNSNFTCTGVAIMVTPMWQLRLQKCYGTLLLHSTERWDTMLLASMLHLVIVCFGPNPESTLFLHAYFLNMSGCTALIDVSLSSSTGTQVVVLGYSDLYHRRLIFPCR